MKIMSQTIKIDQILDKQRLDTYLSEHDLADKSRSYIQTLIKDEKILVNDQKVKTGYILKQGDLITLLDVELKTLDIKPVDLKLDIVYEDDDLLVINKPQGLVVHPASTYHQPTLVHGLMHQVDHLSSINGVIRPGIVHRIDKDTSGLLVVAKTDQAHQLLSEQLKNHEIIRNYTALVYHSFDEDEGTIKAPIGRHPKNRLKMTVLENGRFSVTHFKVLKRYDQYTLLSCELETGRTHQIRVHMAYINHPVVGDPIYGPKKVISKHGQFLHATDLSFIHPIKKEHMTFHADIPLYFKNFLDQLE
ncbi:MAG: RluA family pseudouridine synthase [Acholeplasmataceae bacterium]|nr:RluA family pseudouridine synthase [Acholeplasmataceae bacterium]